MPAPQRRVPVQRLIRDGIEMAFVHAGFFLVARLPRRGVVALSRILGALVFRVVASQRRVALANLELAFGDRLDPAQRRAVARASFQGFFRAIFDFIWFSHRSARRLHRWFRFDPSLERVLDVSPAIVVTAHFGNWELMGQAGMLRGGTLMSVAAMFPNQRLNRFITALRERHGMMIAPREGALRSLLRALRDGCRVALVMDQNTRISEGGVFVDFFGLPVTMSPAASVLSVRTGAPILPVFCLAMPDGSYLAYASPLLEPGRDGGEAELSQRIADVTEEEIRKHPEQWLWMYRRWKYIPPGRAAAEFPFYSHPAT